MPGDDAHWLGHWGTGWEVGAQREHIEQDHSLGHAKCCRRVLVSAVAKQAAALGRKGLDRGMCAGTGVALSRVYGMVKKTQEIGSS